MRHRRQRSAAASIYPPQAEIHSYAECQGALLTVKVMPQWSRRVPPAKRGVVAGFSKPARIRMLRTIAKIQWSTYGKSVFITLTYPDPLADRTLKERTADRSAFVKWLERWLGKPCSILWRLEYVPRKSGQHVGQWVPHWHLIPLGVPYVPKGEVRQAWRRILGVTGPLATDVRSSADAEHTAKYVAKYCSKEQSVGALDNGSYLAVQGRAWGITRMRAVVWAERHRSERLSAEQEAVAMDVARHMLGRHYLGSYFLFHQRPRQFLELIASGGLDPLDGGRPVE